MKMGGLKKMSGKLAEAVETVKDAILPAPSYKTVVKKFDDAEAFAKALIKGDFVTADAAIGSIASLGITSGSTHEIDRVDGEILVLKGGKQIRAEWFIHEVKRRERVRIKADRKTMVDLVMIFAQRRWSDFSVRVDSEIATAKSQVLSQQQEVERAQSKLKQATEAVANLERAKVEGTVWPRSLGDKLMGLIDQKLFTNFEYLREGDRDVFVAYTGPLWIEQKVPAGAAAGTKPEKIRGEYAMKIYPQGSPVRIVVENVAPGKLPGDVPYNQLSTGACNICFGDQNSVVQSMIQSEEWMRALTMVRVYLEGNRSN